jgi:hypothetical protein
MVMNEPGLTRHLQLSHRFACLRRPGRYYQHSAHQRQQIHALSSCRSSASAPPASAPKRISGFNDQYADAVMVIDSTYSMNGAAITNAKTAALNFKKHVAGYQPLGNVKVGVAPLRGCYRDTPMPSTKTDCIDNATQSSS